MTIEVVEETRAELAEYVRVPISFRVIETFGPEAIAALRSGAPAVTTPVAEPYWKDYDAYAGNRLMDAPERFPDAPWTILAAYREGERVGGAVVLADRPDVDVRRRHEDAALLWDLRVAPAARHQGIGMAIMKKVEALAMRFGARRLLVETQQINVPACRFYQRNGFELVAVDETAYPELPDEILLLWMKWLRPELGGLADAQ